MSKKVSILVLDYLKPLETRNCLRSIKDACRFDHQVIFYANGGDPSYSQYYQEQGLIDILISNKENIGCGPATIALFKACDTDYAIYLQQDQAFGDINIDQSMINSFKEALNKEMKDGNVRAISFAGYPAGENTYSERCHLINTKYYNDIPKTDIGGPGITNDKKYTEQVVQEYFEANGHRFIAVSPPLIVDSGKWSVRELPDGSIWAHRCDTKALYSIRAPLSSKQPKVYPPLSCDEWEDMVINGWADGKVPEEWKPHVFRCWPDTDADKEYLEYLKGGRLFCPKTTAFIKKHE